MELLGFVSKFCEAISWAKTLKSRGFCSFIIGSKKGKH